MRRTFIRDPRDHRAMSQVVPSVLREALQPVVRVLDATLRVSIRITPDSWGAPEHISAMAWWSDGSGQGLYVTADDDLAARVVSLADQV